MFQQLPMYQRIGSAALKKDLTNTLNLTQALGKPHLNFKAIHVAGTNGKGSTSHMLSSILQEAGYKVGLYTSPHLKDFRERIKIDGEEIPEDKVISFIVENKAFLEENKLSFFEMSVGMAFDHFSKEKVDFAVVEVGLGGRLDSTNIITPVISVITNIGMDHIQLLGNSLSLIAYEKAGVIKQGVPVIIGEIHPETISVFKEVAEKRNAQIIFAEEEEPEDHISDLKGDYQRQNIRTAVSVIRKLKGKVLNVSEENVEQGLLKVKANTGLRGRWDILQDEPKVICDTAHNAEGLNFVLKQLSKERFKKLHLVLGVVNDKELHDILPLFPKNAIYYFCKPDVPRGMEPGLLQAQGQAYKLKGKVYPSVTEAYNAALIKASKEDVIFVGGSTFTVAEII